MAPNDQNSSDRQPRAQLVDDDKAKASLISVGNLLICLLVSAVFACKAGFDLMPKVGWSVLAYFWLAELGAIFAYWYVAIRDDTSDVFRRAFYVLRGEEPTPTFQRRPPRFSRLVGVWIPVFINFGAFGYLVLWTGGPMDSPFAPIPLVMASFGQIFVRIPEIKFKADRIPGDRSIVYAFFHTFRFSLLLVTVFYASLLAFEGLAPQGIPHAKIVSYLVVNAGIFVIGLGLTLFSFPAQQK